MAEQNISETNDDLRECYRLIVDNVTDIIWIAPLVLLESEKAEIGKDVAKAVDAILGRWRFSFVNPAVEHAIGYVPDEFLKLSIYDIVTPASLVAVRERMIVAFSAAASDATHNRRQNIVEVQFVSKNGTLTWGEIVSVYLRDNRGLPTTIIGITRDISQRRKAEHALRESEGQLRCLFENLPDFVLVVDRNATITFANHDAPGASREQLLGANGFGFMTPEYKVPCRTAFEQAFSTGKTQSVEAQDVYGHWWACRVVPISIESDFDRAMIICTDITQERLATEAVNKEQRLLRKLLEIHEKERQLTAYEIHDGFAQQLTGALFRMEGFREMHAKSPEQAWKNFDSGIYLMSKAIDETRQLINGLRPPILDESGIVSAIEYLICEHERNGGPNIEFTHNVSFDRLAPPLETAIFRIVQESLQNACRHSRSEKVRVKLTQQTNTIRIDVWDWGVGFSFGSIEEQRFGLQGIRERARLLDGRATIESVPGKGTHVGVELPIVDQMGEVD
jgi:PAS domain S-box-containing protein